MAKGAQRRSRPPHCTPWAQPAGRALPGRLHGVIARAGAHRPFGPGPLTLAWTSAPAPVEGRSSSRVHVGCPSPAPETTGRTPPVQPPLGLGRYEGTARLLGRRDHPERSLPSWSPRREHLKTCVVQPCWGPRIRQCRRHTLPGTDCARPKVQRKKRQPSASRAGLSLDNRGPSMWPLLSSSFYYLPHLMHCDS
jgi:hypothetical protein